MRWRQRRRVAPADGCGISSGSTRRLAIRIGLDDGGEVGFDSLAIAMRAAALDEVESRWRIDVASSCVPMVAP